MFETFKQQYGIDLEVVGSAYTLRYAIKVANYVVKKTRRNAEIVAPVLFPKVFTDDEKGRDEKRKFIETLQDAGFRLQIEPENFIDNETHQMKDLDVLKMYYLGCGEYIRK